MSETSFNQIYQKEVLINKPLKKRRIWWRIILFILIFLLSPIGFVYAMFFDNTTKNISNIDQNFNIKDFGSSVLVDSFDNIKVDKQISIRLGEKQLDSLLYQANNKLPEQVKKFLPKIYSEIDTENNIYNFYADVSVPLFKTRLCISTLLADYKDYFKFEILDINAGRITGLDWTLKAILNKDNIQQLFSNTGLSIKFDLDNMCLTYNKKDMLNDLTKMMGTGAQQDNLFTTLFDELINLDLISIDSLKTEQDNYLTLNMDLDSLSHNSNYVRNSKTSIYNAIKQAMPNALSQLYSKSDATTSQEASLFIQDYIDSIPQILNAKSNYGGNYLKTLASTKLDNGGAFHVDLVDTDINPLNWYLDGGTRLTNEQIDNFISSTEIIGKTTGFYDSKNKKFAYVTINDMYSNITNGHIDFVITLDINGLDTYIILTSTIIPSQGEVNYKLDLQIGDILIGKNVINNKEFINKIAKDYLMPALTSSDGLISFVEDQNIVSLNFEQAYQAGIAQFPLFSQYTNVSKFKITTNGSLIDDDSSNISIEFMVKASSL